MIDDKPREVGVGGVRRERQDRRGRDLQREVDRTAAVHRAAHLRQHRLVVARVGLQVVREHGGADEQRAEDHRHRSSAWSTAFFDSGLRNAGTPSEIASTPVSATAPDEKPLRIRNSPRSPPAWRTPSKCFGLNGTWSMWPKYVAEQAVADEAGHQRDVAVGRHREELAGFLQPAQVAERDDADQHKPERDALVGQAAKLRNRDQRGDAGRDRHRDGEDVVEQDRRAGQQRRLGAEVLAADDVGAAAARVGEDRLAVARDDDRQQERDRDADRHQHVEPERRGSMRRAR